MNTNQSNKEINYNHLQNPHSLPGPIAALPKLLGNFKPDSLLDVGCGTGTWLKAAQTVGIKNIFGIDGINLTPDQLLVRKEFISQQDLTQNWNLNKKFDVALCLEVGEHLDEKFANTLIQSLVLHSDWIIFGAACPEQPGQHHVNCQWPAYWQQIFNQHGYVCHDDLRWKIWGDSEIEPWYRQNIFSARRNASEAGRELRISSVIHPSISRIMLREEYRKSAEKIGNGSLPASWYAHSFIRVLIKKTAGKLAPKKMS